MRIVVNDIAASSGGAMTVLKDFYTCVCNNDRNNEWIFLLGDKYFDETENVKIITLPEIKKSSIKKLIFDFFTGKKFINKLNPDVVFSMQNIITFGLKVPQVVYMHQSIPFQTIKRFSFLKRSERNIAIKQYLVGAIIKLSVKKADKVIVQTEWIKDAVSKMCSVSKDKVVKVLPNVKDSLRRVDEKEFDCKNFFYPTSNAIYKNNVLIYDACKSLNKDDINYNLELTISDGEEINGVNYIGRISYEEVIEKYCKSTLVFPSYIETFGYPLAEARMTGTIILAADTPFAKELLSDYENAYFFNPFKSEELADLMRKVINGEISIKSVDNEIKESNDSWIDIINQVIN